MHSYLAPTDLLAFLDIVPTGSICISSFSAESSASILSLNLMALAFSSFLEGFGWVEYSEELTTSFLREEWLSYSI